MVGDVSHQVLKSVENNHHGPSVLQLVALLQMPMVNKRLSFPIDSSVFKSQP